MSGARHRRRRPEATIHAAVCEHLRLRAKPDVLWLHPANGGTRDIREAARFKRMGVLAGASDLLLWHRGNSFALELKAPGGRPTEAQLDFLARFNEAGGHSACAEGVDRVVAVLESWQLLREHAVTYGQVFQGLRRSVAARARRSPSSATERRNENEQRTIDCKPHHRRRDRDERVAVARGRERRDRRELRQFPEIRQGRLDPR